MLEEKLALMIKALPKHLRRNFVPAPDFAKAAAEAMTPSDDPLAGALSRQLQRMSGVEVPQSAWQGATLPSHLIMRFEVRASDGRTLRAGRDLAALQADYAAEVEDALLHFSGEGGIEREAVSDWNFGDLDESVDMERGGVTMRGWPALEATADGVAVKLFATEAAARTAMPRGVRALYREVLRDEVRYPPAQAPRDRRPRVALHAVRRQEDADRGHRRRRDRRHLHRPFEPAAHPRRVSGAARRRARRARRHRQRHRRAAGAGVRAAPARWPGASRGTSR